MIEIISHVYNPPGTDQYAQLLKWQLASLVNHPPVVDYRMTVFYCGNPKDKPLINTLDRFPNIRDLCTGLDWKFDFISMSREELFRRAIGRNYRALKTEADVIWFTDCDYLFGEGCLDSIHELMDADSGLCIPETVKINVNHATGYAAIERERENPLPQIVESEFKVRKEKKAIGGIQLIGGNLARKIGYLKGTSWVEPVDASKGFRSCRCDKVWRTHNNLSATRLPIKGVYRLRHVMDGRNFDALGNKGIDKENW